MSVTLCVFEREKERERWEMKCDKEKGGEISGKVSKQKKGKESVTKFFLLPEKERE